MRRHTLVAVFLLALAAVPARATVLTDAREMSAWMAKMQALYAEFLRVTDYTGQIDEISTALIDGEITEDFALRTGQYLILQARLSYKNAAEELDCCLAQPKVDTEVFVKAARIVSQYLRTFKDQMLDLIEATETTFSAAIEGDADVVYRLQLKQFDRWIMLLESENVFLGTQKLLAEESHPQHPLFRAIISGNEALAAAMSYLRNVSSDHVSTGDVNIAQFLVQRELLKMRQAINDGRQTILNWNIKISTMRPKSVRDRNMVTTVTRIIGNYKESFEIEEHMASTISSVADAILVDDLVNASREAYDTEFLKLEVLVNQRLQLQSERVRLVAEMDVD